MDTTAVAIASAIWGVLSGIAVCGLGVFMLRGGHARPRGAFAFGLFAVFWGIQVTAGNLAKTVADVDAAATLVLGLIAFLIPTAYLLVEFAAAQSVGPRAFWWAARILVGVLSLVAAVLFVTTPELLFGGMASVGETVFPRWGPLQPYLLVFPHFLAFGLALVTLSRATFRAATPRIALRTAIPLAGLGIYTAFAASNNAMFYVLPTVFPATFGELGAGAAASTLVFSLLALVVLLVVVQSALAARAATVPEDRRLWTLVAAALGVPLAWGALEAYLALTAFPTLETVGVWRLLGVAVLAYGIAKWRIYDLRERATRVAADAAGAGAAVVTGAAAYGAGTLAASGAVVPIAAGLVVLGASLFPAIQLARRLFGVERSRAAGDLEGALYGQRIDAYRAAVEASLARATFDEDQQFLAALRERFNITPDEDRVLTHLAKSSVIVARDRDAWDAYERLRLLGEGGGGRTWLARDRVRDRLVVLKEPLERWQLEPAAREAVLREARLAAKVRHPNVVSVDEVVEGKGSPVIVMEYLEGGSLGQVLRARGTLTWAEARAVMLDVLRGIEAVHANGIVHRDIKPSNILLTAEGVAKVADFGIAVAPQSSGPRTVILDPTHSTIAGTLHYMAPEARAGATPDRRADVYACAAVLHEMLYGAPPGLPSPTVVRSDLPAGLAAIVERGLAVDPEQRFPTARALADELARIA